jgi:hypothetical protein
MIQSRQDVLLNLLIEGTVSRDVYNEKYTALQNEKATILLRTRGPRAGERAALRGNGDPPHLHPAPADFFSTGDSDRKMTLLKLVASNPTLESQKARLNLRPAFAVVAEIGPRSDGRPP